MYFVNSEPFLDYLIASLIYGLKYILAFIDEGVRDLVS